MQNIDPTDFAGNTEKYRGKQIALKGNISFVIFASDSFQDDKGKIFKLYLYETGDDKKYLSLKI